MAFPYLRDVLSDARAEGALATPGAQHEPPLDAGAREVPLGPSRAWLVVKRTIDIVFACLGLLLVVPFGLLIALAIRLDTRGAVIFRQTRVGRHGVTFQIFKFRTMVHDAERSRAELEALNESAGIFKLKNDPRSTRVGRLLRRGSLDELPQLLNVLRGEMSLVGPRPLVSEEDQLIEGPYRRRLQFNPGMTGPWQALGPVRPTLREMVVLDCLYVENWSLWTDVKILLQTLFHVLRMRGI